PFVGDPLLRRACGKKNFCFATGIHGSSALSTVLENKPAARGSVSDKLAFFNGLQSVTNTIHATTHLDEIILDLGRDICSLFGADRLRMYVGWNGGEPCVT